MFHGDPLAGVQGVLSCSSAEVVDIGKDHGDPISPTCGAKSPFPFTGKIGRFVFDLSAR
jgi:hypothetical protein